MSALHDGIWETVPADLAPGRFAIRCHFLLANVAAGDVVLDLGCGAGEFSAALNDLGAQPIAVDVAAEALRRATASVPGLDVRLWKPGEPLPLDDVSVDVVWAGEVIEHVVDVAPWLSEIRRVLRPGGTLLLTTPHHGPLTLLSLALSRRRFAAHFEPRSDHVRFFSPATLRALLGDLGFEVVELRVRSSTILVRAVRPSVRARGGLTAHAGVDAPSAGANH
ncbi:MAG TPA: class I SAM-dependent methyltransferase [Solirubrobacteraceae bacterium]|nr:class I SAM-dependent methyltransferase [Solirubrobacteraceae bacterium]